MRIYVGLGVDMSLGAVHLTPPGQGIGPGQGPGSRKTPRSIAVPPLDGHQHVNMQHRLHSRGGVGVGPLGSSALNGPGPNTGRQALQTPQQQAQQHLDSKLLSPPHALHHIQQFSNPSSSNNLLHNAGLQNTFADEFISSSFVPAGDNTGISRPIQVKSCSSSSHFLYYV